MKTHFTRSSTTIDFLIAATAVRYQVPLITANVQDFERLPGVLVIPYEAWSPAGSA